MFPRSNRKDSKMASTTFSYTSRPQYPLVFFAAMTLAVVATPVHAQVGSGCIRKAFPPAQTPAQALTSTPAPVCSSPGSSKSSPESNSSVDGPDFCLTAETKVDEKLFEHESFDIRNVVKASMTYHKTGDESHKTAYEELWYHNGKPVAMERKTTLDIPSDKKVAIKILQSSGASNNEIKAAANVILRLVLDIRLNNDTVSVVEVPSASFQTLIQELQARKARVQPAGADATVEAKVKFKLQSRSTGMEQVVYFI